MGNWQNVTLGDLGKAFARYRPFVALVAAIVLVVAFLPGDPPTTDVATGQFGDDAGEQVTTDAPASQDTATSVVDGGSTLAGDSSQPTTGGGTRVVTGRGGTAAAPASGPSGSSSSSSSGPLEVAEGVGPDCDTATGRVKVPSRFAPPCKPTLTGGNGGATSTGVTGDSITIVWYRSKADPLVTAALTAAGAADEWPDTQDTVKVWADYLNHHFNLWGRKITMHIVEGQAEAEDDAGGRADAIALADKYHPFLVINAINNAMVDELVARKIICICTTSQPQEFYASRAPYAGWTTLMSSTQGYIHRAEYIAKRLHGRKAKWAGFRDSPADPMSDENRVFGLLYYETPEKAYKSGIDFFKQELGRWGVPLKVALEYPNDLAAAQEQTRPLISRLKSEGVTSVVFAGDPITPATFTAEANNQRWQPEWIVTGSALTDTSLFGRTYNQDQWSRAFGISFLSLRMPPEQNESYRIHQWHAGRPPAAGNTYPVLYAPFFIVGVGFHMAGPKLTPETFGQGLFDYPVSGQGMVTAPTMSYGRKGIWDRDPWRLTDFTLYDDVTEIWWDRAAPGRDEVGHDGVGMYRYVDNGKRYLPGAHPTSDPRVFDPTNAPTTLDGPPPSDKPPAYDHQHYYG